MDNKIKWIILCLLFTIVGACMTKVVNREDLFGVWIPEDTTSKNQDSFILRKDSSAVFNGLKFKDFGFNGTEEENDLPENGKWNLNKENIVTFVFTENGADYEHAGKVRYLNGKLFISFQIGDPDQNNYKNFKQFSSEHP